MKFRELFKLIECSHSDHVRLSQGHVDCAYPCFPFGDLPSNCHSLLRYNRDGVVVVLCAGKGSRVCAKTAVEKSDRQAKSIYSRSMACADVDRNRNSVGDLGNNDLIILNVWNQEHKKALSESTLL